MAVDPNCIVSRLRYWQYFDPQYFFHNISNIFREIHNTSQYFLREGRNISSIFRQYFSIFFQYFSLFLQHSSSLSSGRCTLASGNPGLRPAPSQKLAQHYEPYHYISMRKRPSTPGLIRSSLQRTVGLSTSQKSHAHRGQPSRLRKRARKHMEADVFRRTGAAVVARLCMGPPSHYSAERLASIFDIITANWQLPDPLASLSREDLMMELCRCIAIDFTYKLKEKCTTSTRNAVPKTARDGEPPAPPSGFINCNGQDNYRRSRFGTPYAWALQ